jgi:translation initiation factor 5
MYFNYNIVFGFELGTQAKMDEKNDRYIINGAHEAEDLANLLDVFIDKFVLCSSCKNPETEFVFCFLIRFLQRTSSF